MCICECVCVCMCDADRVCVVEEILRGEYMPPKNTNKKMHMILFAKRDLHVRLMIV